MHAVKKVDAVTEPMKSANATVWSERNTDPIFKDFIDEDRNLLLKQYQLRAGQNVTVNMGPTPRSEITYTMNDGPFEGQDPRELVDRAITWISDYLDEVDRRTRAAEEPVAGEPDSRARIRRSEARKSAARKAPHLDEAGRLLPSTAEHRQLRQRPLRRCRAGSSPDGHIDLFARRPVIQQDSDVPG